MKIKTLDIQGKEWRDKVNGNAYFPGLVTVNFGMESEKQFKMPFQYGYAEQYRDEAFSLLKKARIITDAKEHERDWMYYSRKNIIVRSHIQTGCKKRELINL